MGLLSRERRSWEEPLFMDWAENYSLPAGQGGASESRKNKGVCLVRSLHSPREHQEAPRAEGW